MNKESGKPAAKKGATPVDALLSSLKQGRRYGCILLEGEEEYTKRLAVEALKGTVGQDFPDMNISSLRDPAPDELIAAAETVPFMSERRLVIVKDSTLLSGKVTEFDEEKALEKMEEYLPRIPAETTVVFVLRGKADERRRMVKLLRKHALCVTCARPTDGEAQKWLSQEAKKRGKTLPGPAAAAMVFTVGPSMDTLSGELEKLVSYTEGRNGITEEDIRAVAIPTREARVFDLANSLLAGDGKQAFLLKRRLILDGDQPLMLLNLLAEQCRRVYYTAEMLRDGKSEAEIKETLGIPDFAVRSAVASGRNISSELLRRMCAACTDTEYLAKSGQVNDDAALETMMLRILQLKAITGRKRA